MPEPRPQTGPVSLPADPKQVANARVHGLASLGVVNRPPTMREYKHAALDIALDGGRDEEVFAVLSNLDRDHLERLVMATAYLHSGAQALLQQRAAAGEP